MCMSVYLSHEAGSRERPPAALVSGRRRSARSAIDLGGARTPSRPGPRRCARPEPAAGRRSRAAVRSNRGAGAGCTTPSTSVNVPRSRVVRMVRRLVGVEHRREADVGALQQRAPLVARPGPDHRGHPRLHRRPRAAVELVGQRAPAVDVVGQADPRERARRTTWRRSARPTRSRRRRSRRPRRTTRRCRAGWSPAPPTVPSRPPAVRASSRRAARRRRPSPRRPPGPRRIATPRASRTRSRTPAACPPPPKSPTRLSGGTGGSPARPIMARVPDSAR